MTRIGAAKISAAKISVACLDMAGTTVADDGIVLEAFSTAIAEQDPSVDAYHQAMRDVTATMGHSKIEVFRSLLGDEVAALRANATFEKQYADAVADGKVTAMPGAAETIKSLRDGGVRVCLATGFSPATRDAIIAALGWENQIDLALSPADAGRGRPAPDLPLTALLRLRGDSVAELAVVGDTPSDVESGLRAGAGLVVGVLTGAATRADFERAGAPLVLDSIADLPAHIDA